MKYLNQCYLTTLTTLFVIVLSLFPFIAVRVNAFMIITPKTHTMVTTIVTKTLTRTIMKSTNSPSQSNNEKDDDNNNNNNNNINNNNNDNAAASDENSDTNEKLSGSFFNPVPVNVNKPQDAAATTTTPDLILNEDNGSTSSSSGGGGDVSSSSSSSSAISSDSFEESVNDLLRRRKSKSRASKPSTIGGVPTAKATGFGKKANTSARVIKTKSKGTTTTKPFVGIGKPMNDVNNPEYDDQGYTLYANEETGEKNRVFEALVEYPCEFPMKIIGQNDGSFAAEIVQVVADSCQVDMESVRHSERVNGKWTSVTVHAPVQNAEMLYALYENIDRDPRVKFKF